MDRWDARFLKLAQLVSTWSKDPSTKTGAVITDSITNRVITLGYNGFPAKMEDRQEWLENREEKYSRIVHCEMNAALFAREPLDMATLYTWPFLSCERCVVHMLQVGIARFVAPEPSADALTRWGAAFKKTRDYIIECGAEFTECALPSDF